MKNWKTKVLALALMLVFALALAACGSNDEDLAGTYVVEGNQMPGVTMTFTNDNFRFVLPYAALELEFDLPGTFVLSGTFDIDNRNNLIVFDVDENALRGQVEDMVDAIMDYLFFADPEFAEMMEDPEFAEMMNEFLDEAMDEMFEEVFAEMMDDLGDLTLRFERNFDRLYDDEADMVFVKE